MLFRSEVSQLGLDLLEAVARSESRVGTRGSLLRAAAVERRVLGAAAVAIAEVDLPCAQAPGAGEVVFVFGEEVCEFAATRDPVGEVVDHGCDHVRGEVCPHLAVEMNETQIDGALDQQFFLDHPVEHAFARANAIHIGRASCMERV